MYQQYYQRFLKARPGILHCSPHSHYYWPDVTREAQLQYWDDSARLADDKWDYMFAEKLPAVQTKIAKRLQLSSPEQIVFAPNTHELLYRIMSSFPVNRPLRILTTDAEFHSFNRQSRRLEERGTVEVTRVATEPFDTFAERWRTAAASQAYELIFISQIFFNSGVAAPAPAEWLDAVQEDNTVIVVDGYHGFGAVPTDWSDYEDRIFYLAGAYKYAQGGEGACFAVVPKACELRPEYTGWFADFGSLAKPQQGAVEYAKDGFRFAGATMDLTALYRLDAVLGLWQLPDFRDERIHGYIQHLQRAFLEQIDSLNHPELNLANLLRHDQASHGHFYTFRLASPTIVSELAAALRQRKVQTDFRQDRLRFGFALYHQAHDYRQIKLTD